MSHLSESILHNTNGLTLTIQDSAVVTMLRTSVDFFVIDAAACPMSSDTLRPMIAAAGDTPVLVRVENTLPSTVQNYLNLGVDGLILTGIQYAAEAEKAIAACLYPPEGVRPYRGHASDGDISLQALNDQITLIVEIATPQCVAQIEEICEVTGINGVLVSPTRLAVAMEQGLDTTQDEAQARLRHVFSVAQSYELPFGLEGEGFDCMAGFTVKGSDRDALAYGVAHFFPQQEREEAAPSILGQERENHPFSNIFANPEDDDFGLRLIARRE